LWNTDTGELVRVFPAPNPSGVTWLALSPDERSVASTAYDGSVRVWDVASGRQKLAFHDFRGWAWCIAYAPDGASVLASGSGHNDPNSKLTPIDYALRKYQTEDRPPR